jgi:glucose-1-phosphate adenylyltransferase
MRNVRDCLVIVLAGGHGERLHPLTKDRSKPAVPFGGTYRIIDFTLSNCVNSGFRQIFVLTQYKSYSLDMHIRQGWFFLRRKELGEFIETIPPQLRNSEKWYQGTGDAIFQNIYLLNEERPKRVLILSGDHIYRMDYGQFLAFHEAKKADITIACLEIPISESERFGTMKITEDGRLVGFKEKSPTPFPHPSKNDRTLASMGVYLFETEVLVRAVIRDAKVDSQHDFGKNIIPSLLSSTRVYGFSFSDAHGRPRYWKDIGTLDSYWEANMDLLSKSPPFDLYDTSWPILTASRLEPPALVKKSDGKARAAGVVDSIVSGGCQIRGSKVTKSILSPRVIVEEGASVSESVIMSGVVIGKGAKIKRSIIDKGVHIPDGFTIGMKRDDDERRFKISPGGIVVVPKGYRFR